MKTDSQYHLDPINDFFEIDDNDGILEAGAKTLGGATFGAGANAVGMANDFVRGDIMGDPYYTRDWGTDDLFDGLSLLPQFKFAKSLKGAKPSLLPKANPNASFLKKMGQGKTAAAAAVGGAGLAKKGFNAPAEPNPEQVPAENPQANTFQKPVGFDNVEVSEQESSTAGTIAGEDPHQVVASLENLKRNSAGNVLSNSDSLALSDARRAIYEKDRLAKNQAQEGRIQEILAHHKGAFPPQRKPVDTVDMFNNNTVKPFPNMDEARAFAKSNGLNDDSLSQARIKQLAKKYNLPEATWDRSVAKDLVDHGMTAEEAMQERGVNPVTGELRASDQAMFDEAELKKYNDFNNGGLEKLYRKRKDDQLRRNGSWHFDTPDQLLSRRLKNYAG